MPLQHQDLPQELDVAARERQDAEARAELFRAAVMLVEQPERNQQRAEKNRVAERLGIALERASIVVDRRERLPECLGDAARHFRRERRKQPRFDEHAERFFSRARAQHLVDLFHQARRRAARELAVIALDRAENRRVDPEVEPCRQRHRPQHADGIFLKTLLGHADAADEPGADVVEAADVVDDRARLDVVEERVQREVAPERVLFRRAERVVVMNQQIGIVDRRARRLPAPAAPATGSSSVPAGIWRRNVATSMTFGPNFTCARRKRRPMIQQFRKRRFT